MSWSYHGMLLEEETFEFCIEQRVRILHNMKVCLSGDVVTGEVGNEREDNLDNREGVVKDERGGSVWNISETAGR